MNLDAIFRVFSRRGGPDEKPVGKPLTTEFRNRFMMVSRNAIEGVDGPAFFLDIHKKFQMLLGRLRLSPQSLIQRPDLDDLMAFVNRCSDDQYFDFVEMIFGSEHLGRFGSDAEHDRFVEDVNRLFEVDDLPYALTGFVRQEGVGNYLGMERKVLRTVAYPRIILRNSQVEHTEIIEPTLTLLTGADFKSANDEFLGALTDYRKGDYGDCLTKCGSSFESVMKVICDRKKWPYNQTDTASTLLHTIIPLMNLDPFFETPLLLIATLRNRISTAHGAGTQVKNPQGISPDTQSTQLLRRFSFLSTRRDRLGMAEDRLFAGTVDAAEGD